MAIHIDLKARTLPDDHRVFLARPGRDYQYFGHFRKMRAIGPDLPLVELDRGLPIDDQVLLGDMLKRAVAFRSWRSRSRYEEPPSRTLSDYIGKRNIRRDSAAQLRAALKGYFEEAKKGDLALIPPSAWRDEALLVEFTGNSDNVVYREIPYGARTAYIPVAIPARRFREVSVVPKRFLPPHVLDIVEKPNIFVEFGRTDRFDLQDLTYPSFVKDDEYSCTFELTEAKYTLEHDLWFASFVKFVAANTKAISEDAVESVSFEEAILAELGDYAPALQSNVNSPGWLKLKGPNITVLVAAVLFVLATTPGLEAIDAAADGRIVLGNSMAPLDDICVAQVYRTTLDFLELIDLDDWDKSCEIARKVKLATGMHPPPTVTP